MRRVLIAVALTCLLGGGVFGHPIAEDKRFEQVWEAEEKITIISDETEVTRKSIEFPPLERQDGKVLSMRFRARLHTPRPGGWNDLMGVGLNDVFLGEFTKAGEERLLNRTGLFETTRRDRPWWSSARIGIPLMIVYYGPGDALDRGAVSHREEGYWYLLNISDYANYIEFGADERIESAEPNTLVFLNAYLGRYLPDTEINMVIEDLQIGYLPEDFVAGLAGSAVEEYDEIEPVASLRGRDFVLEVGSCGAMELEAGDDRYRISSRFSYPSAPAGHNFLGRGETGEALWRPEVKQVSEREIEISAAGASYGLTRRVALEGEKIEVHDTFANKTERPLGVIISYGISLPALPGDFRLGGMEANVMRGVAENPTIFISEGSSSLGFVAEDNVLRAQGEMLRRGNVFEYTTKHFGLDAGKEYTLAFSLYPQENKSYFNFINRVRRDWDVNFTIDGPFVFHDRHVEGRKAAIYTVGPWFGFGDLNPATSELWTHEDYKRHVQPMIRNLQSRQPDVVTMGKLQTNLFSVDTRKIEGGEILPRSSRRTGRYGFILNEEQSRVLEAGTEEWKDSVLRTAEGNLIVDTYYPGEWREHHLNLLVYPEKGNHRHNRFIEQIDFLMDEVGFRGVYIDQFSIGWGPLSRMDRCTYEKWDGRTVDIDEETGRITRKYTDCSLAGAEARRSIVRHVLSKGGVVVANSFSTTREEQSLRAFRFAEFENDRPNPLSYIGQKPPALPTCVKGHLASPIILGFRPHRLGEEGERRYAEVIMKSVITALRNGLLYYYYGHTIPASGPGSGEYGPINRMFPFTPVELGEGYLVGEERIISAVSGDFKLRGRGRPVCYLFDLKGREKPGEFKVTRQGDFWKIEVALEDWNEIAVIERQ